MAERVFIKGNDAIALAALKSGMTFFAGYPITPASEIPEYLAEAYQADRMRVQRGESAVHPGFTFIQCESEIGAINAVLGAASTGARAMTASSSPGISLKMEGISYLHGSELPAVVIDIMRGGPGLGNIAPEQSDYMQVVKGGGHGSYRNIVLAPSTIQEMYDFVPLAFDIAFKYRMVAFVLADSCLGQMKESLVLREIRATNRHAVDEWALDQDEDRKRRLITSLYIEPENLEKHNLRLEEKYGRIAEDETLCETFETDDAEIILVGYGICARIARGAVLKLREEGIRAGLIRPQTLWPFPTKAINGCADDASAFLVVEMSMGQLVEDVRLAVNGAADVSLYHRMGGMLPVENEIVERVRDIKASRSKRGAA